MSVATENSAGATAIQPFTIPVPRRRNRDVAFAYHGDALAREGDRRGSIA